MARILVIGGGVAGLTAAFRLCDRAQVTVIETAARLGGQIHTELDHGFVIERGAEGFVARSEALPALARDLGMPDGELVGQEVMQSYGFDGQRLLALQPGEAASFLGFQVPADDLGRGIRSFRRGMGSLIAALEGNLRGRAELRTGIAAKRVEASAAGVRVALEDGAVFEAERLIVATSAASAAGLLAPLVAEDASVLHDAPTTSSLTVELAYERGAIAHPLDATGFVVALDQQAEGMRACTFTSSKFADRAPPRQVSLRLFFRPSADELVQLSDSAFTERAVRSLRRVLSLHGEPLHAWISRWPHALPVFSDAHRARVTALETALRPFPIVLAGSAFHGSGIDAAVRSGERAAAICSQTR